MPTTEPLTGARVPTQTDGPLGGLQIANGIRDLADNTIPRFTTTSDRDTKYAAWVAAGGTMANGMTCWCDSPGGYYDRMGGTWVRRTVTDNAGNFGPITATRLRLTDTGDASETSTGHAFQVGPDNGLNMIIDQNEILPRNNGALAAGLGFGGVRLQSVGDPVSASDAATKGYVDGEVFQNAGNLGAIVGSIPSAGTPLLVKTIKKQVVTNGNGDGAAAFPGGAFPNGVLSAHATTATDEPFFWVIHSLNNTLAQVSLRAYNITTGTVAGGLSIATSITAIGW